MTDQSGTASAPPRAVSPSTMERPTPTSEWTLIGVLMVLCVFAMAPIISLAWGRWPDGAAHDRIHYLGWIALGAVICIGGLIVAFMSPWVGTVRASGMGANIDIEGKDGQ